MARLLTALAVLGASSVACSSENGAAGTICSTLMALEGELYGNDCPAGKSKCRSDERTKVICTAGASGSDCDGERGKAHICICRKQEECAEGDRCVRGPSCYCVCRPAEEEPNTSCDDQLCEDFET
jgi:hypothetical protein